MECQRTARRFEISINGKRLKQTFGTKSATWTWHDGGSVTIDKKQISIGLHDLTGFDGRCDAILLTKDNKTPPNDPTTLADWRREQLGLEKAPRHAVTTISSLSVADIQGWAQLCLRPEWAARSHWYRIALSLAAMAPAKLESGRRATSRRGKYPLIGEIIRMNFATTPKSHLAPTKSSATQKRSDHSRRKEH